MKVRKAVFPVAGFGTRFLPATKAQPKEMFPIVDKPAIQYAVEEVVAAGIEAVIMVTGRGKDAIENHFDRSVELEQVLIAQGKEALLEEVILLSLGDQISLGKPRTSRNVPGPCPERGTRGFMEFPECCQVFFRWADIDFRRRLL